MQIRVEFPLFKIIMAGQSAHFFNSVHPQIKRVSRQKVSSEKKYQEFLAGHPESGFKTQPETGADAYRNRYYYWNVLLKEFTSDQWKTLTENGFKLFARIQRGTRMSQGCYPPQEIPCIYNLPVELDEEGKLYYTFQNEVQYLFVE